MKGDRRYRLPLTERQSHGDEWYSIRNTVRSTGIELYGDRW